ncbi:hypothetical protein JOB18_028104 [Solea senegalensis]|uniref:C-type lectin domain-containing protein n=1 Tax=Solea senegalensis TaxID=28829 RepID=A0AAV6PZS8_SOLSE|nr:C-type mannose receptor 2-like isoform X1 [Solea senegalensis]XP_043888745.1 C-type mannose receptor 2-like isoform X1 [Solea senegalensis]KAG7479550.1 hypothetical protein JOB18_028104 [Solea senegalensis]KAG7479551.1 hypothetical protein JOB18_028104 [Solea senegalensis]
MGCHVTLTLLFVGWSLSSCSPPRMYYQVNQPMTWLQAQNFCKEHYTDLATFESHDDIRMLEPTIPDRSWFGLFDDPKSWQENLGNESNSWRWSVTGETGKTTFKAWASGEPSYSNGNEVCVIMNPDGTWADTNCLIGYTFVCYTVTNQSEKVYHFIPTGKSWNSAQEYCRQHYTDLAMIETTEENALVFSKTGGQTSWLGLYRVPWTWSDGSHSSFKYWEYDQPNNYYLEPEHCAGFLLGSRRWHDAPCNMSLPFICHRVTTLKTTVGMQIRTDADMTDPAVMEHFLQQIHIRLTNLGFTDFKLQWKNLPSNQTKKT